MTHAENRTLLDALLDSWDRNNTILVNLLHAIPSEALDARVMEGSFSIGEMFGHMNYCRLLFVAENAPDFAMPQPKRERMVEGNRQLMAEQLAESARTVRVAVERSVIEGREMQRYYDHPILFLQHMIWHEGYHHGQIKLALKMAGKPMDDEEIGRVTWDVWMDKS